MDSYCKESKTVKANGLDLHKAVKMNVSDIEYMQVTTKDVVSVTSCHAC